MIRSDSDPVRISGHTPWFSRNSVEHCLSDRQPFRTHGALRAVLVRAVYTWGELDDVDRVRLTDTVAATRETGNKTYVVYSYDTPIAWCPAHKYGMWTVPAARYSRTTTRHQNRVRLAVAVYGCKYPRPEAWGEPE